jgi:hypothetical protein
MSLATVASIVTIGGGIYNATRGQRNTQNAANQAAERADPFGNYRDQFAQRLLSQFDNLTNQQFDPSSISLDPAYQFAMKSGTDAVNRGAAASGMLGSGNRLIELEKLGVGLGGQFASQQQDRQWNRNMGILGLLGNFSGANINPAAAGQLMFNGQQAANNQFGGGLNAIGSGLGGLSKVNWGSIFNLGGGGSGGGYTGPIGGI